MAVDTGYPDKPSHHALPPRRDKWIEPYRNSVSITAYVRSLGVVLVPVHSPPFEHKCSCPIPGHVDKTPSFFISEDQKRWLCLGGNCPGHKGRKSGDAFDLAMVCGGATDLHEAAQLLAPFASMAPPSPSRSASGSSSSSSSSSKTSQSPPAWKKGWAEAGPVERDGPAERYLTVDRGLTWPPDGWDPARVREHKACPWEYEDGQMVLAHCLLVAVHDHATGEMISVWRIRLPDYPGQSMKERRKAWTPVKGHLAQLSAPGPEVRRIAITEGIENAWALQEMTGIHAWSGLSASFLPHIGSIDRQFEQILLFPDNDPPKPGKEIGGGQEAMEKLLDRLRAMGHENVTIHRARRGKDANDVLRARSESERQLTGDDALQALFEPVERKRNSKAGNGQDHDADADAKPDGRAGSSEADPPSLILHSMADIADTEPKPRRWIVPLWVPAGYLSALYGKGGGGKTTLVMQLAAAGCLERASDRRWLGMEVNRCRPLALFCEDQKDEIEYRLHQVARAMGQPLDAFKDFLWAARYDQDNLLVARVRGQMVTTPFYDQLRERIADEKRDVVFLDGITDIYGGNVNDPAEVAFALNRCIALGSATNAAVVPLGHPNKAGTSDFLGCITWENKPRARLNLGSVAKDDDRGDAEEDLNDPRRVLSLRKANMAALVKMDLIWDEGVFRTADPRFMTPEDKYAKSAREAHASQTFLRGLAIAAAANVTLSPNLRASNYGPKALVEKQWAAGFATKRHVKELEQAMNQLMADGRVAYRAVGKSSNRRDVHTLVDQAASKPAG